MPHSKPLTRAGRWLSSAIVCLGVALLGCQAGGNAGGGAGSSGSAGASAGVSGSAGPTAGASGSAGATAGASGSAGTTAGAPGGSAGMDAGVTTGAGGSTAGGGAAGTGSGGVGGGTAGTGAGAAATGGSGVPVPGALVFGPYKDTSINMNWNTNVISTKVGGAMTGFADDMAANGKSTVTLSFATGECGAENWGGLKGTDLAAVNVPLFMQAGIRYILSTGGAAGSFTCGSDAGMTTFIDRWMSPNLVAVDFDIEAGQSAAVVDELMARIKAAHGRYPKLRFSLTLATLAPSAQGAPVAASLGTNAPDGFNPSGDQVMAVVAKAFAFSGTPASWPSYLTVNLMTMDYGSAAIASICVVSGGACQMGQSAIQAAYNLHDKWGVPYAGIELTPMIGGNDAITESFTLSDADAVAHFAATQGLAGVHYWSYDRDVDCPPGYASPTCNSIGGTGPHGYLKRFQAAGLK
jgi:chitinase